jgi:tetratricopeptide (TPR) repeat protein
MSFIRRLLGLDVTAHLQRAEQYERIGKLGMARLELEKCLEIVGADSREGREGINAKLDQLTALEQEDAEARAQEAMKAGDPRKARYYLNVALSKLEEGSPAHDSLMVQLHSLPVAPEEAQLESELEAVLRADAGVDFVDRQRTLEFWKSGFPPYREEYYFNKALTSEVVRAQAEQVSSNPNDADACFNFGITLAQLGLINKALEQLRHFVELRPDDREGHYFLANLLADQGYDDEAVREFEKTIEIDPEFQEAYLYLGRHYVNLGDEHRAEKIFEHLAKGDSVNDEVVDEARASLEEIRSRKASA